MMKMSLIKIIKIIRKDIISGRDWINYKMEINKIITMKQSK